MTLIEDLIEKKQITRTNLVKACTALLASVTVLTSCGNAAQANGDKRPSLDNDPSISQSNIDSETQSNYEKLMEACRKTEALGPIAFESNMRFGDADTSFSAMYFSNKSSAFCELYDGKYVKHSSYAIYDDGGVRYANENVNVGEVPQLLYYQSPSSELRTFSTVIQEILDWWDEINISYSIDFDNTERSFTISRDDGDGVSYVLRLDKNGAVKEYDSYDMESGGKLSEHFIVNRITQIELDEKFYECASKIEEYRIRYEEQNNMVAD